MHDQEHAPGHVMIEVANYPVHGLDTFKALMWCPVCGAYSLDTEYDGRYQHGRLVFPKITLAAIEANKQQRAQ